MSAMDEHIQACHAIDVLLLHSALMCVAYGFRRWEKEKETEKRLIVPEREVCICSATQISYNMI